jgi:DNA-directed RNA polymerase specialized sigma24 family protein
VAEVLSELPEDMQTAFRLCRLEGRSAGDAGEEMGGRSANAVRVLVCKAMKRIRDGLKERGVQWGEFSSL